MTTIAAPSADIFSSAYATQCDSCSAPGNVFAIRDASPTDHLLFCKHHARKHGAAMVAQGWSFFVRGARE